MIDMADVMSLIERALDAGAPTKAEMAERIVSALHGGGYRLESNDGAIDRLAADWNKLSTGRVPIRATEEPESIITRAQVGGAITFDRTTFIRDYGEAALDSSWTVEHEGVVWVGVQPIVVGDTVKLDLPMIER